MEKTFEKIVHFSKPYDKRNPDPAKNYGIGGSNCWMILKGRKVLYSLHLQQVSICHKLWMNLGGEKDSPHLWG